MRQILIVIFSISFTFANLTFAEIWTDNFDDDVLNEKWMITQWRPNANEQVNWLVEDGVLKGEWPNWNAQFIILEEYPSLNYTVQVRCRIDRIVQMHSWNGAGIVFRSSGPGVEPDPNISPFYAYGLNTPHVRFAVHTGQSIEMLRVAPEQYDIDEWYTMKIIVRDDEFLGYLDDRLVCALDDDRYEGKFVGLMISCHTYASFDDFMISDSIDEDAFSIFSILPKDTMLATTWAKIKSD